MNPIYIYHLEKMKKLLKLIPVYLLQKPGGYNLHLYGLMPLIGLVILVINRKVEKEFIPFIIVFVLSIILSICGSDWLSARRSLQTLCMAGFSSYLINFFSDQELKFLAKNSIYLIAMYYCYDFIFGKKIHVSTLKIIETYFLTSGVLDNMNYTGFLSAGLGLFFAVNKEIRLFILALVLVFISQSKTAFFCIMVSFPIFFITDRRDNKLKVYAYVIYIIILLYPLILLGMELILSDYFKMAINLWSGSRYSIHLSYLEQFCSAPLGVGYDRSHELIGLFINRGSSIVETGLFKPYFTDIGAHNSYLKILSELGLLGYFSYLLFIFIVLQKSMISDRYLSVAYMAICASQLWLEGLNEFIVYFWTAVILRPSFYSCKTSN